MKRQAMARGICPMCGASVAVRKDGTLRIHQNRSSTPHRGVSGAWVYPHCRGTDQAPLENDDETKQKSDCDSH